MKKVNFSFVITVILLLLISIPYNSVNAATGNEGYAVYRDGVAAGLTWHAAIMDQRYPSTTTLPVVQATAGNTVKAATWASFLNGNTFVGVYRPNSAPSSYYRDLFKAMGRVLADEQISYNVAYQVYYNTSTSGPWVDPAEISSMRCDGVVEYIYEYYGFRVAGNDDSWDVSKVALSNMNIHSGGYINPKSQTSYLTKLP